jgi:hypothetical protein
MFARLGATSAVAVALLVPSLAFAQDPPPADAPAADAAADASLSLDAAAPAADASGDAAGAEAAADDAAAGDASDGRAGDPLPVAQSARPLVLPHMVLSPSLGVTLYHLDVGVFSDTFVMMGVGATLGLGDIAEVEVSPFTSALSPSFEYGATLGGTVRLVDTEMLELGPRLRMLFTTDGVGINPGLPVRLHVSDMVRVDTGVQLAINTNEFTSRDTTVGLAGFGISPLTAQPGIPLEVTVNPIEQMWLNAGTGFGIASFEDAGDTIFVPLSLGVGGTVPVDDHPLVDVGAQFGFPYFIGTLPGADTVITELWSLSFVARANLDLNDMMK